MGNVLAMENYGDYEEKEKFDYFVKSFLEVISKQEKLIVSQRNVINALEEQNRVLREMYDKRSALCDKYEQLIDMFEQAYSENPEE